MVIQNSTFTGKSKIIRIALLLILLTLFNIISFWNTLMYEFGLDITISWLFKLSLIFVIIAIYSYYIWKRFQKKYFFIYFTDDDKQNLVFRFYHIKTFGRKYTTYKIPINLFQKFEIVKDENRHELFLYQKVKDNKIAKYPPISIAGYSQEEITQLQEILETYLPKN